MSTIVANFTNRPDPIIYTRDVLELLKNDPDVIDIVDLQTGEIIYSKKLENNKGKFKEDLK